MRPIQPSAFSYLLPQLVQGPSATLPTSGTTNPTQGNGGFSLQVPDGTVTGGNPRGLGAVDLQMIRTAATQVASGAQSFVVGSGNTVSGAQAVAMGSGNTASGAQAVAVGSGNTASGARGVAIGLNNTASGAQSVAAGSGNTASGVGAFAAGTSNTAGNYAAVMGQSNSASNDYAFAIGNGSNATFAQTVAMGLGASAGGNSAIALGYSSNSNAAGAIVLGSSFGTARGISCYTVFPASDTPIAGAAGVSQTARLVMGRQTTNATPTVLTSNTSAAGTGNQVILPNNSAYFFKGQVIANVTGAGDTKGWVIEGVIKRGANAASTAIVGAVTVTSSYADAGASAWAVAVTADTTNGGIKVEVTGQASTTIRWVCSIDTTEVTF